MSGKHLDADELIAVLIAQFNDMMRVSEVKLSEYAHQFGCAAFVYENLPVQHPAKKEWGERVKQRKRLWEHYLDVLARNEHSDSQMTSNF